MNQVIENVGVLGEITARFYDQSDLTARDRAFNKLVLALRKQDPKIMRHYRLGKLVGVDEHKNVICKTGFNAVTRRLTGDTTYTAIINKALLGTGVGSAAATDTTLITEVYRNDIASGTDDEHIAYLTAYYSETEVTGTFTEFGNVIDGTGSANTGQLWSHISGLNWVKTNTIVLVVSCKYTFQSI